MQHKVNVTVFDKKPYPELQQRYCADPRSGACPLTEDPRTASLCG